MASRYSLAGTIGVVTGAGSAKGIGKSTVKLAAEAGAKVIYATDIVSQNFNALIEEVKVLAPETVVKPVILDVTQEDQVEGLMKTILKEDGKLDWFFANAGIADFAPFMETTHDILMKQLTVNTVGAFNSVKWAARALMNTSATKPNPGGSIVVTTSLASTHGGIGSSAYTIAKHATAGLVKSAAAQFYDAGVNININGVAPGKVSTTIGQTAIAEGRASQKALQVMMGLAQGAQQKVTNALQMPPNPADLPMEPEEIASVAVFLMSPAAKSIQGQNIAVDRNLAGSVIPNGGIFEKVAPEPIEI